MQADFDILSTTTRAGRTIDEIEFATSGGASMTGYLVSLGGSELRPGVLAVHDGRGNRCDLLGDLRLLADKGFVGLAVDCPEARQSARNRDPLGSSLHLRAAVEAGWHVLAAHPVIKPLSIAAIGVGLGGSAAASFAAQTDQLSLVIGISTLSSVSRFIADSDHALAAGIRLHTAPVDVTTMTQGLRSFDLSTTMSAASAQWLVQFAEDDDLFDCDTIASLRGELPVTARISAHPTRLELVSGSGLEERVALLTRLCR